MVVQWALMDILVMESIVKVFIISNDAVIIYSVYV